MDPIGHMFDSLIKPTTQRISHWSLALEWAFMNLYGCKGCAYVLNFCQEIEVSTFIFRVGNLKPCGWWYTQPEILEMHFQGPSFLVYPFLEVQGCNSKLRCLSCQWLNLGKFPFLKGMGNLGSLRYLSLLSHLGALEVQAWLFLHNM